MKKDSKYGIVVTAKRDLTKEEADFVKKTMDLAASSLRLHLKDSAIANAPNKSNGG
ncbi:MAG: hypothetical protein IT165_16600 [Bryobacterales bacterium]|jgi:hypothetical protein|nr:hypothetical protein [Bryobacterales bacterium]